MVSFFALLESLILERASMYSLHSAVCAMINSLSGPCSDIYLVFVVVKKHHGVRRVLCKDIKVITTF